MTPSVPEIRAQITAILERDCDARVVAMHAARRADWPGDVAVDKRTYRLAWCESPLEVRLALLHGSRNAEQGLVLLTPLSEGELGADVLARVSRARIFRVHQWEIVRNAFRAKVIDGRLSANGWMADALIELMPARGYAPVPGGILDVETAWRALLQVTLGIDSARPDVEDLLRFSLRSDASTRWSSLSDAVREGLSGWLASVSGEAAELILGAATAGYGADAVSLGLVADVLVAEEPPGPELAAAAARAERYTGGNRIMAKSGVRWADAAKRVLRELRELEPDRARSVLAGADRFLAELYLSDFAALSGALPSGLEARLLAFAEGLQRCLSGKDARAVAHLERLADQVEKHALASSSAGRVSRVQMARRLVRWWMGSGAPATDFQGAIRKYVSDGSFVDWARLYLLSGDQLAPLAAAFDALANQVRRVREQDNEAFAKTLKAWNDAPSTKDGSVPVEEVLDRVIAPLCELKPVLLLVMDGLSLAVLAELFEDILQLGWDSVAPESEPWSGAAIAVLPTVTEVSRASLLSGRLAGGGQHAEKTGFARNSAAGFSRSKSPRLFHKGELMDGATLAPGVRDALSASGPRMVAVVYNAIDDQLDGASQFHVQWTVDRLRILAPLLYETRAAGRVVVLTADHGHVLDQDTTQSPCTEGGDRWRRSDGTLHEGEIALEGGRVLTPTGETAVTLPWTERIRYGTRKNGYHGGASPQEVLVPLHVLAPTGATLPGWAPTTFAYPEWWHDAPQSQVIAEAPPPARPNAEATARAPRAQADWLAAVEPVNQPSDRDWTLTLIESSTYRTQKSLAARVAPPDDLIRRFLQALSERGGKLSKAALSNRLSMPASRIHGFVRAAQRVLNLDQAPVLTLDERSGAVELNHELLEIQFGLRKE